MLDQSQMKILSSVSSTQHKIIKPSKIQISNRSISVLKHICSNICPVSSRFGPITYNSKFILVFKCVCFPLVCRAILNFRAYHTNFRTSSRRFTALWNRTAFRSVLMTLPIAWTARSWASIEGAALGVGRCLRSEWQRFNCILIGIAFSFENFDNYNRNEGDEDKNRQLHCTQQNKTIQSTCGVLLLYVLYRSTFDVHRVIMSTCIYYTYIMNPNKLFIIYMFVCCYAKTIKVFNECARRQQLSYSTWILHSWVGVISKLLIVVAEWISDIGDRFHCVTICIVFLQQFN